MLKKILALFALLYAAMAFAAVDVNKASAADLDGIKGIGPALSSRIIEARKTGDFKDWNDFIARVNGVGDKTAAKFSAEGLTVNGASFGGAPAKPTSAKSKAKAAAPAAAPAAPAPAPAAPAPMAAKTAATPSAAAAAPAPAASDATPASKKKAKKDAAATAAATAPASAPAGK